MACVSRHDQLVFHAVLPANQFGDRDLVATGLQVQATQHVGDLAAHFTGMNGVAPQFSQRRSREAERLGLPQTSSNLGLAARYQHHGLGFLFKAKRNSVISRRITGM